MATIEDIRTPAVIVDERVLLNNIRRTADLCQSHGVRLRPHIKTHNVPEIAHWQIREGASGVTVATLREAAAMATHGITDIFIAREITGWPELGELARVMRHADITTAVDSNEGVARLTKVMAEHDLRVKVLIEVDVGGNRCGTSSINEIAGLATRIGDSGSLALHGIFTHEGHVYSAPDRDAMKPVAEEAIGRMGDVSRALADRGIETPVVSIGSSPAAKSVDAFPGITEMRPGNYVFNDAMQLANGSATLSDCALKVLATVISKPDDRRTVLNVGTKLLGSDTGGNVSDAGGYGVLLGAEGRVITRVYEEHAIIEAPNSLRIGERVTFVPSHACTAANLARVIYLVHEAEGTVTKAWRREVGE